MLFQLPAGAPMAFNAHCFRISPKISRAPRNGLFCYIGGLIINPEVKLVRCAFTTLPPAAGAMVPLRDPPVTDPVNVAVTYRTAVAAATAVEHICQSHFDKTCQILSFSSAVCGPHSGAMKLMPHRAMRAEHLARFISKRYIIIEREQECFKATYRKTSQLSIVFVVVLQFKYVLSI